MVVLTLVLIVAFLVLFSRGSFNVTFDEPFALNYDSSELKVGIVWVGVLLIVMSA